MQTADIPARQEWKQDLAQYTTADRALSYAQIASALLPYLAIWALAILIQPGALLSIGLGLVATIFLMRTYSLFHDLTHNSLFPYRGENAFWGTVLGYFLFTPYRWWQRQHAIHHAHSGNLDNRGVGEIDLMTVEEYESAGRLKRFGYRLYRNPILLLLVGPTLVFLFERRFPQKGMSKKILLSVILTNLALVGWAVGLSSFVGWGTFLLLQGTTLVAGGAVGGYLLYVQHQYEETYYQSGQDWSFELAALQGSSYLELPRPLVWMLASVNYHHVHHLSAKIPNYHLQAAHENHPMFKQAPVITPWQSLASFRLKLWDTESESLIPFPKRGLRLPEVPDPKAAARDAIAAAELPERAPQTEG